MIDGKSVLAIIPARGGSKGLSRKNLRPLKGRPLLAWTIAAAQKSGLIDRLILTSEDEEIRMLARGLGCEVPFDRPADLARDEASMPSTIMHAISSLPQQYDLVVLLQPTSPLRVAEDIDGCIRLCVNHGAHSAISVAAVEQHPYWMFSLGTDSRLTPYEVKRPASTRRQDLPALHIPNGAVYVVARPWFERHYKFISEGTVGYEMPMERSIDVDSENDLRMAELLVEYSTAS